MKKINKIKIYSIFILLLLISNISYSQLNGTYTIGTGGDYTTITSAVSDVVASGVNGPVVFNILSGSYNERVTIDPIPGSSSVNTVTFQSQTGNRDDVLWTDSVNFTSSLVTLNGADHITFKNISFRNGYSLATQYAFYIQNNCEEIYINGNNIICISTESFGIYYDNAVTKNLIIENNLIDARTAIGLSTPATSTGTKILNNQIKRYEGIIISNNDSLQIEGNEINVAYLTSPGGFFANATGIVLNNCNQYLKISKNKIIADGLPRFNASKGMEIQNCALQNSLIANNFIVYTGNGGLLVSNSSYVNIYFNSIHTGEDQLNVNTPNLSLTNCENCIVKNNIVGGVDITRISYTSNTNLSSDHNTFIPANGSMWPPLFFNYNGNEYYDIDDYIAASGKDSNSNVYYVFFVSNTNLHLAGSSIGNDDLIGIPISGITDDIDGDIRSAFYPYKGADEADIVLPVELNSFSSVISGNNVILNWRTTSEINNSGFEIERSTVNGQPTSDWIKVGNIAGNGTTALTNNYSFTDRNLNSGNYKYRLKQFDFNGNFEYFNLSNEVVIGVPNKFSLSQNYPNPFNPNTVISYQLPYGSFVSMKIYDISGREIAALVNEKQEAGYYSINFTGAGFSSGVYFYSLKTDRFTETKRMTLLK